MVRRVGPGPVFAFEWRMTARRWQTYAMRSTTVLLLLGAMWIVWQEQVGRTATGEMSIVREAEAARAFFGATAMILLGLVGLAAPAAAAGSICLDKARGNLTLLFATDLSDAEIVLGKLAARLVPVLGLILCATPALSIATLFGGIDPVGLVGALLVVLACASLGLALATWMPRVGRAVGTTVGLYTMMCIGWIWLTFTIWPGDEGKGVAAGSPLMGVGIYSALLAGDGPGHEFVGQTAWTIFWALAHAGVALALLLATLGTFNRCLGRVDDPSLVDDDDLALRRGKGDPVGAISQPCSPSLVARRFASRP
jgi:ABC-type transport system involved in multi-copper enzyme maturation permease subunit